MNHKVFKTLEYDKIVERLSALSYTESGKQRCLDLKPSYDLLKIQDMQEETEAAMLRIIRHGKLDLSGIADLHAAMKRLSVGGVLNMTELQNMTKLLEVVRRSKRYDSEEKDPEFHDCLSDLFFGLSDVPELYTEITRCIISETEMADDASPALKAIRRKMHSINDKIHEKMNELIIKAGQDGILQDNIIAMRNGRYCLSVKADSKARVPGMVHDQSAKGSTFFIEPLAVVNLNNELTELELDEAAEIEKILAFLSGLATTHIDELRADFKNLTSLDFIFARGTLAVSMNAVKPSFNTNGIIKLRSARHPLLDEKIVVPIDIELGDAFDLLVVTGPNTGGKTVSLKTVGLLTLMGQAGLHIPTKERSELSLFEEVYADIGDEQSIEQNLSTFSSHMKNIVNIENVANEKSLILFDELCAGTDPTEGAALAISILEDLKGRGARLMVTTHYAELKLYALTTPRVENACCEFDVATLSPTYKLLIGVPGKSNAFAISQKLGLKSHIIEDASRRLDKEDKDFEDVLSDLEEKRVALNTSLDEAKRAEDDIVKLKESLSKKNDDIAERRKKLIEEATIEANRILSEAKDLADETIRDFNRYRIETPDLKKMEEKRAALRKKMDAQSDAVAAKAIVTEGIKDPSLLHIGDTVRVHSLNLTGTVHTLPDKSGNLFVQCGIMRSNVNISDLSLVTENLKPEKKTAKRSVVTGLSKAASIHSEINLIGMTSDEAIAHLDKYIDDAYVSHLESVRIVHGKGTGTLRSAVQSYLRKCKYVESFRAGVFGEGDAGVTIAVFKK
ncbi:MAG: endonuclease MutS2 [Lachnospiraceae bacterium]|nr:endonuclease MutS2 [Lachnospiraceae bacterium]